MENQKSVPNFHEKEHTFPGRIILNRSLTRKYGRKIMLLYLRQARIDHRRQLPTSHLHIASKISYLLLRERLKRVRSRKHGIQYLDGMHIPMQSESH